MTVLRPGYKDAGAWLNGFSKTTGYYFCCQEKQEHPGDCICNIYQHTVDMIRPDMPE